MTLTAKSWWHRVRHTRPRDILHGRINGQLDWRQAVAGADLPVAVADTISLVVRKTRLWKREQLDVTLELIAHFQDGLETGLSGEELLASFGDTANAARLIRRSKKRGRPFLWQAWWWASRSMAALFAVYGIVVLLLAFDRPRISTDYLAILNKSSISMPEDQRGWPYYQQALAWLKANTEASPRRPNVSAVTVEDWLTGPTDGETLLLDNYPKLDTAQRKVVDAWLNERAEFLVLLRKAARQPRLGLELGNYSPQYRRLFGMREFDADVAEKKSAVESSIYFVLLPHIQAMRGMARVLKADLQRSAFQGNGTAALADLRALTGMARHGGQAPWLVCGLVKCGLLHSAMEGLETVLAAHAEIWSTRELAQAAHLLAAVSLDVRDYVQGEKTSFFDLVQRLYSDDGRGDGYLTAAGLRRLDREVLPVLRAGGNWQANHFSNWQYLAAAPATYFVGASRRELLAKHAEMWARMEAEAERPLWDPLPTEETAAGQYERMSPLARLRYGMLDRSLPAYRAVRMTFEKAKGLREGALLGIALQLYRREHGKWPESLNQLVPLSLPSLPIDRINGGPLRYRIVDGQPVIYSLGVDGKDDGGVLPDYCMGDPWRYRLLWPPAHEVAEEEKGDWVIWSTGSANSETSSSGT